MSKIQYKNLRFKTSTADMITLAEEILAEYQADGYDLTVRQLYYQFVARGIFPEDRRWTWTGSKWVRDPNGTKNADPNYKWLGGIINKARLAGLLDWSSICDRTRSHRKNSHWRSPDEIIRACAEQYRINTRELQPVYLEVWVEKDALIGVLEGVCTNLDVGFFSCRGYVSQSAMWRAAQRIRCATRERAVVLHLGDHDPSGIDMTRDIADRLELFGATCEVERIALTMAQIKEYGPPSDPAKVTDSRYAGYIKEHGSESWELDALEPRVITDLIRERVQAHTDVAAREIALARQDQHRGRLVALADNWEEV